MTRSHKQQGRPTLTQPALPVGPWSERRADRRVRHGPNRGPARTRRGERGGGVNRRSCCGGVPPGRARRRALSGSSWSGPRCPARWPVATAPSCSTAEARSCPVLAAVAADARAAFLRAVLLFRGYGAIRCAVRDGGRGAVGVCVEYLQGAGRLSCGGHGRTSRALPVLRIAGAGRGLVARLGQ